MIQWNLKSSGAKAPCGFESAPGNGAFRSARVRFRGALAGRGVEHDQGNVEQGWRWSWFIDRRADAFAEAGTCGSATISANSCSDAVSQTATGNLIRPGCLR